MASAGFSSSRCRYVISYRLDGATVEIRFIFHPRQAR
jgi:hypothetical protein